MKISSAKLFWWALPLSLLYFYYKGWTYAQIGSYLPIQVVVCFTLMITVSYFFLKPAFLFSIKLWGLFLLLSSIAFFTIETLFFFTEKVTEAHIRNQFTLGRNLLAIFFLGLGYYALFKMKRTTQTRSSD